MDLSRRRLLRLSALGAAGVAGCASRRGVPDPDSGGPGTTPASDASNPPASAGASGPTDHPLPTPTDHCGLDPDVETDDPLAVSFDARGRFGCQGEPLSNFESLDSWEVHTGSLVADEERVFSGTQSARVEAAASEDRARIHRRFPGGVDLSGYDLSLAVNLQMPAAQGVTVHLAAPDNENALLMGQFVRRSGWIRLDLGPYRQIGSPDLSNVTRISVQVYTGGGTRIRYYVDSLRRLPRADTGRLVLTFNGNRRSHYEQVFEATEQRGVRGVLGVTPGSTTWRNRTSRSNLREMYDAGWDLASSPRGGGGFGSLPAEAQATRIRESKRWLVEQGFERGADVLVWPAGRYDRTSVQVARRYHHIGFVGGRGPFGTLTDPLVVGRVDGSGLNRVKRLVDLAGTYDQTLVLSYNAVGNGRTGIARETFEETLAYADERGLEVATATDLVATLEERIDRTPTPTPGE